MIELVSFTKTIEKDITSALSRAGLMFRIFSRVKTEEGIRNKINSKGYAANGKTLQDSVGVRITLYFKDDIDIATSILKSLYKLDNEVVDVPKTNEFSPQRINFVFVAENDNGVFEVVKSQFREVDKTFEVQLRTVFAEGWHEVDHDLKYKCKEDWENKDDFSRVFNGINATLETCDWSLLTLFDKIAHDFYKEKKWEPMIRNMLRMRFRPEKLNDEILGLLNSHPDLAKSLYRCNRKKLLNYIHKNKVKLPLNLSNIVYLLNHSQMKDERIKKITPEGFYDFVVADNSAV